MTNYLFEFYDSSVKFYEHRYVMFYGAREEQSFTRTLFHATRAWKQDEQGIKFIKNRYHDPDNTEVDLQEFIVLQLKAETITL